MHLKNDLALEGKLHSTDQYMNFKLEEVSVKNPDRFPQFVRCKWTDCSSSPAASTFLPILFSAPITAGR